jgi:hypothetical protein
MSAAVSYFSTLQKKGLNNQEEASDLAEAVE